MNPLTTMRLALRFGQAAPKSALLDEALVQTRYLCTSRGEVSGTKGAETLASILKRMHENELEAYFVALAEQFGPDPEPLRKALDLYASSPTSLTASAVSTAAEAAWRKVVHQLNLSSGGTALLIELRRRVLDLLPRRPELEPLEADLQRILASWFNRGFLTLRRIDWNSPASLLEKLLQYEAVHPMAGWDDLRRRLASADRRCFAFFHPAMDGEPLIFVEVALTDHISTQIAPLLAESEGSPKRAPTTAIFYSISNCQSGLRKISFGNLLIKQVVDLLRQEIPSLKCFSTLSPMPGFAKWLADEAKTAELDPLILAAMQNPTDLGVQTSPSALSEAFLRAAALYLTRSGRGGRSLDPVAHFHLSNGARIEQLNWQGNTSPRGLKESWGVMVNYRYLPDDIEKNFAAYNERGVARRSGMIDALLREPATRSTSFTSRFSRKTVALDG